MAFSATDWRDRLAYFSPYLTSRAFGDLGNAQGNLKYYSTAVSYGGTSTLFPYLLCTTSGNYPVVEAFYASFDWAVSAVYQTYILNGTFFQFYESSPTFIGSGTATVYWPQFSYGPSVTIGVTPPNTFYNTYSYYYGGFYSSAYVNFLSYRSNPYNPSPSSFYNYKNGPFLSYYQYSLSSGYNTNFPYQVVTVNGSC
jgi:hypothetical protein